MKIKNRVHFSLIVMLVLLLTNGVGLKAQDWPQWRGSERDGISKEAGLNLNWSEKKPPLSWVFRQAGAGYSSPVIIGTMLYCQGAADGNDFAFALDTKTGSLKWKQTLGDQYIQDRGDGPRGSVTIDGDKLYLIRGGGQIHCLSAADGKILWQKEFINDFGGKIMSGWGFSESPLIDGKLVVCTPGGENGTMVALDKNTGELVWRTQDWTDQAGYSSPVVAEIDGVRQYIQQASKGVAGVSAKDGKILWKIDNPAYRIAVIPTPVINEKMVYVTNGYGAGCMGIRLKSDGDNMIADTVYTDKVITNQHGGVVLVNGYIYGFTEPPASSWVCQNMNTGEIVWSQKGQDVGVGKGAVFGIENRLLLLEEKTGSLTVVSASPDGWKEFGKIDLPQRSEVPSMDRMVWTHPVIAAGKLYLRDHDLLFCFDLKK